MPAGILIFGSVGFALLAPDSFTPGGWFTGVILLIFAVAVQFTSRARRQ